MINKAAEIDHKTYQRKIYDLRHQNNDIREEITRLERRISYYKMLFIVDIFLFIYVVIQLNS